MEDIEEDIRAVNESFYAALSGLDVERMGRVWLHDDWVRCIHPGADLIEGWPAVEVSWARIFRDAGWLRVVATNIEVTRVGDIAIVVCTENITAKTDGDVRVGVALATNLYLRTPADWRMVHHHDSPAPVTVTQRFSGTVQ